MKNIPLNQEYHIQEYQTLQDPYRALDFLDTITLEYCRYQNIYE